MASEDAHVLGLVSEKSIKSDAISADRRDHYTRLLSSIGPSVMVGVGPDQCLFTLPSTVPFLAGPGMKQIAYVEDAEIRYQIVRSLDKPLPRKPNVYIVPIERNWYIMYNND